MIERVSYQQESIHHHPHSQHGAEKNNKSPGSAEGSDFVGHALAEGQAFLFFHVNVAGNVSAQHLVGGAQPPAHDGEQVHGSVRMLGDQLQQVGAIQSEQLGVVNSDSGGGASAAVHERDLSEQVAGKIFRQDDLFAFGVLHEDFDAPRTHDVKRVTSIAVRKNGVAFVVMADVENLSQRGPLFVVEQLEERYL